MAHDLAIDFIHKSYAMSNLLLTTFGSTALPIYNPRVGFNLTTRRQTVKVPDNAFDAYRGDRAPIELPRFLSYGAGFVEGTPAELAVKIDELNSLIGKRLRLWGTPENGSGIDRWAWAVLTGISYEGGYQYRTYQPLTLTFELWSLWNGTAHGGAWNLDAGYYFDNGLYFDTDGATILTTSPQTVTVQNGGNYQVDNAGITITAGSADITYLKVGIANVCEFQFTDTIVAGMSLVVDCGAHSVLNNGVDAYTSNFQLTANHKIAPWLRLAPGSNSVIITKTGGATDSTIQFTYSNAWA